MSFLDLVGRNATYVPDAKPVSVQTAGEPYHGDGKHEIDILALKATGSGVAIELKLGLTRQDRIRLETECADSHEGRRFKGSMVALLGRRLALTREGERIAVEHDGDLVTILKRWALVCREPLAGYWLQASQNALVFHWEDLGRALGADEFNRLVRSQVAEDWFSAWKIAHASGGSI
jgi:hypothetical protein